MSIVPSAWNVLFLVDQLFIFMLFSLMETGNTSYYTPDTILKYYLIITETL